MKKIVCLLVMIASVSALKAQVKKEFPTKEKILAMAEEKKVTEKKFRWGISWNQYWTTITGSELPKVSAINFPADPNTGVTDLKGTPINPSTGQNLDLSNSNAKQLFLKPSIGFNIRAEYYVRPFIGIGIGVGLQQRGTGIINPDNSGGSFSNPWVVNQKGVQGDRDSTYRERLRFNSVDIPVSLLLRTPKDIIKGVKLSASAGALFVISDYVNDVFLSVEDGFHKEKDLTDSYNLNDVGLQFSVGPEIDIGATVFQLHFIYAKGTDNVFKKGSNSIFGSGPENGKHETIGFRVAWLF